MAHSSLAAAAARANDRTLEELREQLLSELSVDPDAIRRRYKAERDRRQRPDGIYQYAGIHEPVVDTPDGRRGPVEAFCDAVVIGGGFGGLLAGARLHQLGLKDIRVIDMAGDFGGTWYWNRYPGARCDVESYIYMPLLEEVGYIPSEKYASAGEIWRHCTEIAHRYDLYRGALFETSVTGAEWGEQAKTWTVNTDRGDRLECRLLVVATGLFSKPKLPRISRISQFEGRVFHTSRWDYAHTGGTESGGLTGLHGRRVAVIGTGATGVQCIPHLAEAADQLYVFQRTPSSVAVRNNSKTDHQWAQSLTPGWQRQRMENFADIISGLPVDVDLVDDGWTQTFRMLNPVAATNSQQNSPSHLAEEVREIADMVQMERIRARVGSMVQDPKAAELLKPWYRQLCKRPCFHDEYLQVFNLPNVHLVETGPAGIEHFTRGSLVVQGAEYQVDTVVLASGFEVGTPFTKRAGFDILGRGGKTLSRRWSRGYRTLHGLHAHGFPNCFFLGRVQSAVPVNYVHTLVEQTDLLGYIVDQMADRGITTIEVTESAEASWVESFNRQSLSARSFLEQCTPGYFNNEGSPSDSNGLLAASYQGSARQYFEALRDWRREGALRGLLTD